MVSHIELSLVVPMYNEESVIGIFFETVSTILNNTEYEIICVNDGSKDNTIISLLNYAKKNNRIKIINLSRNFGKEIALTAGLDYARGQAVIPIDCDLQDPPELILEMMDRWRNGYDVVLAKRVNRDSDTFVKKITSVWFYKLINKISDIDIPENVGDFRLLDRKVVDTIKLYPEKTRFMKGIFATLGYKQITLEFVRPERAAGYSSWRYIKLYTLAIEGFVSFTSFPLKVWSYIGFTFSLCSFLYGLFTFFKTMWFGIDVPGYASMMVVFLFVSGLILMGLGVIGEYLSRIFLEVKNRPLYIVMDTYGFDKSSNN